MLLKKKKPKPEDFIGETFNDGKLMVVGVAERLPSNTKYYVTCTECSKDKELFPDEYFISTRGSLKNDQFPCGCSFNPKWKDWQFLILARRVGEKKGFVVHGFVGEFKYSNTKLNLECLKDGYKWIASINNIINGGYGCRKCSNRYIPTEQEALQKCIDICKEMNYDVIGLS